MAKGYNPQTPAGRLVNAIVALAHHQIQMSDGNQFLSDIMFDELFILFYGLQ